MLVNRVFELVKELFTGQSGLGAGGSAVQYLHPTPCSMHTSWPGAHRPGDPIIVHGLVKNALLNGQLGVVMSIDDVMVTTSPEAVAMCLDLGPEVALKPHNLRRVKERAGDEATPLGLLPQKEEAKGEGSMSGQDRNAAQTEDGAVAEEANRALAEGLHDTAERVTPPRLRPRHRVGVEGHEGAAATEAATATAATILHLC